MGHDTCSCCCCCCPALQHCRALHCIRPPQGCKCLIAIERAKLVLGKPDPDSAYWN